MAPAIVAVRMLPRKSVQGAREQSFLVQHFLSDGLEDPLTSHFAIQILNHAKRRLSVLMIAHEKQGEDRCSCSFGNTGFHETWPMLHGAIAVVTMGRDRTGCLTRCRRCQSMAWQVTRFRSFSALQCTPPSPAAKTPRILGPQERALVLEFLPACVANAKTNSLVGLTILLEAQ